MFNLARTFYFAQIMNALIEQLLHADATKVHFMLKIPLSKVQNFSKKTLWGLCERARPDSGCVGHTR